MLFIGEYNHSIDAKSRAIVPSRFRDLLGDLFVVTKGLDNCLWIFPEEEWSEFSEKLRTLPLANKDARKLSRFFQAGACELTPDKQGRILLPQNLREYAGIEKDLVMVGVGSRIEIWSKERWDAASTFDDMDEVAEQLGELGFGI